MSKKLLNNLVYQDEHMVVIDKPPGYHVHPPENFDGYPIPRSRILLYRLRDHFQKFVYPVHRLDVATSGLLLYTFSSEVAGKLSQQWGEQTEKKYWAVVRGYFPSSEFSIEIPLESDSSAELVPCQTDVKVLHQVELPFAVGKRFPTSRYSWIEATLKTGRFHQIRRHMNRVSHPVVGDGTHGDSHHNRFFRETLKIPGLCLRAQHLHLIHPVTGAPLQLTAPPSDKWAKIHKVFSDFDQYQKQL